MQLGYSGVSPLTNRDDFGMIGVRGIDHLLELCSAVEAVYNPDNIHTTRSAAQRGSYARTGLIGAKAMYIDINYGLRDAHASPPVWILSGRLCGLTALYYTIKGMD